MRAAARPGLCSRFRSPWERLGGRQHRGQRHPVARPEGRGRCAPRSGWRGTPRRRTPAQRHTSPHVPTQAREHACPEGPARTRSAGITLCPHTRRTCCWARATRGRLGLAPTSRVHLGALQAGRALGIRTKGRRNVSGGQGAPPSVHAALAAAATAHARAHTHALAAGGEGPRSPAPPPPRRVLPGASSQIAPSSWPRKNGHWAPHSTRPVPEQPPLPNPAGRGRRTQPGPYAHARGQPPPGPARPRQDMATP